MSDITLDPAAAQALDDLSRSLEEAIEIGKTATAEVQRLREDNARKDRVILEKVASAAPALQPDLIAGFVGRMHSYGMITKEAAETYVKELTKDPNGIVKVASRLLEISRPAPSQGAGISKEAASGAKHSEPDPDGWGNVIRNGA